MDIDFLNSYTEVLTENFDAVLKQNLMFQTQLKIVQKQKEEKEQLQNNLNETIMEIERLNQLVSQQQSDLSKAETLKQKVLDGDSILSEKNRIQQSLNETLQKIASLESLIHDKEGEVVSLRQLIATKDITIESQNKNINELKETNEQNLKQIDKLHSDYTKQNEELNKKIVKLKNEFEQKTVENRKLLEYTEVLKQLVPPTKLKKVENVVLDSATEKSDKPLNIEKVQSGGTF